MALPIQAAANSMIGSAAAIQAQRNENIRKGINIAIGAATGGAGGAIGAAAKEAGINSSGVNQLTGYQAQLDQRADERAVVSEMNRREIQNNYYMNASQAKEKAMQKMKEAQDEKRNKNSFLNRMNDVIHGGK